MTRTGRRLVVLKPKVKQIDSAQLAKALGAAEVIPLKSKTAAGRMAEGLWLWLSRRAAEVTYRDEDQFVLGQKIKLALAVVLLAVVAAYKLLGGG